jgi:hypothetical protein
VNDLFIPKGLQPLAQGWKSGASGESFPTLGNGKNRSFVRGTIVVFRRSATEDEINRTHFGLGNIIAVPMAYCSAEHTKKTSTQGSLRVRETHFEATLG